MSENSNAHEGHRQRMWKKYLEHGIRVFEEHEMLEMLLFILIPRINTNVIAHDLIDSFGSIQGVLEASYISLKNTNGIGQNSAMTLKFIGDIINYISSHAPKGIRFHSNADIIDFCIKRYKNIQYEALTFYLLDKNLTLLYKSDFEITSQTECSFNYKEVVKQSVLFDAYAIFISHNHIDGNPFASNLDITVTRALASLMNSLSVKFIDHIVVQNEQGHSMRESGEMKDIWQ